MENNLMKKCIFPSFSYNTISKKLFPDFLASGRCHFMLLAVVM